MTVYLVNIALIFLWLIILRPKGSSVNSKIFLFLCFFQIVLISTLRSSSVGTDTAGYLRILNLFVNYDSLIHIRNEHAFLLLMQIVKVFELNQQWLFFFSSVIVCVFLYRSIVNFSPIFWLSIFIFITFGFFAQSIHIMRQFIAMSIFLYGYKYILNKNIIMYALCLLLAFYFHN